MSDTARPAGADPARIRDRLLEVLALAADDLHAAAFSDEDPEATEQRIQLTDVSAASFAGLAAACASLQAVIDAAPPKVLPHPNVAAIRTALWNAAANAQGATTQDADRVVELYDSATAQVVA